MSAVAHSCAIKSAKALYNEIDPYAAQWLRNLIDAGELPAGTVDERDIREIDPAELMGYSECHFFAGIGVWARAVAEAERAWARRFRRPLWTGSPPCQPISSAGKRKGHADTRHLWPAFHRLIAERRPATLLGEQVSSKDGLEWLSAVRADLERTGYAIGAAVIPAAGVGAPHLRYRSFFVADARYNEWATRPSRREFKPIASVGERLGGDGVAGLVADAGGGSGSNGDQPGELLSSFAGEQEFRAEEKPADIGGLRETGLVADAARGGRREECADAGRLAVGDRTQGVAAGLGASGGGQRPTSPDSFWADADWVFCRDGKWRPNEPGSFPLVDGSAFRLGSGSPFAGKSRAKMMKGYGNACVLPAAVAFLEATLEAIT